MATNSNVSALISSTPTSEDEQKKKASSSTTSTDTSSYAAQLYGNDNTADVSTSPMAAENDISSYYAQQNDEKETVTANNTSAGSTDNTSKLSSLAGNSNVSALTSATPATGTTTGASASAVTTDANTGYSWDETTDPTASTYYSSLSEYDKALPTGAVNGILQAKQEYATAQANGDTAAMAAAYNKAQYYRAAYGGYIDSTGDGSGKTAITLSAADSQMSDTDKNKMYWYQVNYQNATTDADKAYWHQMAEDLRGTYGYSGGTNGSGYEKLSSNDSSRSTADAAAEAKTILDTAAQYDTDTSVAPTITPSYENPTYDTSEYSNRLDQATEDYKNQISGIANDELLNGTYNDDSTYSERYTDDLNQALADMANYDNEYSGKYNNISDQLENYSYDPESDAVYQAYANQYGRNADAASKTSAAHSTASTGGLNSSYSQALSNMAAQYYMKKLSDVIPTLAANQQARLESQRDSYADMYNNVANNANTAKQNRVNSLLDAEAEAYNRYNTDRDYGLNQYNTNYSNRLNYINQLSDLYGNLYNGEQSRYETDTSNALNKYNTDADNAMSKYNTDMAYQYNYYNSDANRAADRYSQALDTINNAYDRDAQYDYNYYTADQDNANKQKEYDLQQQEIDLSSQELSAEQQQALNEILADFAYNGVSIDTLKNYMNQFNSTSGQVK